MPKVDRGFNTPVDRTNKGKAKLTFQPRRVVREGDSPDEDIQRTGLGKKDKHDEVDDRGAQRRNHFHRREAGAAPVPVPVPVGASRGGLESDSQSGSDEGRGNARAGRARADSSGEAFSAPRGADTRWK